MKKAFTAIVCISVVLAGCAKRPNEISAKYVSPSKYSMLTCDQIGEELNRVASQVNTVTEEQDDAATRDAVATGVGIVLFWPALFLLAAGDEAEELARLKGEYEALDTARRENQCQAARS